MNVVTPPSPSSSFAIKSKAYVALLKPRLTLTVVISAGFGYAFAAKGVVDYLNLLGLLFGGFVMTGAANILNQIIEKDSDGLMKRTTSRPLPNEILSINEALGFCFILLSTGFLVLLTKTNPLTAFLTFISVLLYAFAYTPMKKVSPFSVLIGAFPGAMPPLIGWAAYANNLHLEAWILFGIQFIWQFPHFWAIAWVLDTDYNKAGFKMLPTKSGKSTQSATQILIYTLFMIPIGLLPMKMGYAGLISGIVITIAGILFSCQAIYLLKTKTDRAAKMLMFGSFIYLPIVQIALIADRI